MEKFLARRISHCLKEINETGHGFSGNKEWTSAINHHLRQIVQDEFKYTVAHTGHYGWMFDVAWLDYDNFEEIILSRLVLAVESEWQTDMLNLRVDLNKLLVSKAFLSVLIFQSRAMADVSYYLELFERSINSINPPYENAILFAAHNYTSESFEFHLWDGRQLSELSQQ
ncbi:MULTISPECIES: hypothetical protein [Nitrospirillum]|uniref:hypothetical protein n=1 Tax=Nitrospirillum amazonense TaxID=28077 RepID=UPI0011A04B5C|nr:hypothetical protein [Nitrospirillum amazonense]MEC4594744.1 hypothetical protein [Nitrospirillum amazonense]